MLDCIRKVAETECSYVITIAALALRLVFNQSEDRQVAQVSKSIAYGEFLEKFGHIVKQELDVNKAVFLLDLLEIGRRKYSFTPTFAYQ